MKCSFDLQKYPMDSQHCEIEMESCKYIHPAVYITIVRLGLSYVERGFHGKKSVLKNSDVRANERRASSEVYLLVNLFQSDMLLLLFSGKNRP